MPIMDYSFVWNYGKCHLAPILWIDKKSMLEKEKDDDGNEDNEDDDTLRNRQSIPPSRLIKSFFIHLLQVHYGRQSSKIPGA